MEENKKRNVAPIIATVIVATSAAAATTAFVVDRVSMATVQDNTNTTVVTTPNESEEPILSYDNITEEPTEDDVVDEEPTVVIPTIDPETVYDFKDLRELLKEYPEELNGSYFSVKVRVQGSAFGVAGCCFFNDVTDKIYSRGHIEQEDMKDMLVRFDVGDNNAGFSRTEITTISGHVSYEHNSYLGVDLIVIE